MSPTCPTGDNKHDFHCNFHNVYISNVVVILSQEHDHQHLNTGSILKLYVDFFFVFRCEISDWSKLLPQNVQSVHILNSITEPPYLFFYLLN